MILASALKLQIKLDHLLTEDSDSCLYDFFFLVSGTLAVQALTYP